MKLQAVKRWRNCFGCIGIGLSTYLNETSLVRDKPYCVQTKTDTVTMFRSLEKETLPDYTDPPTWLADEEADVVTEHWCVSIQEVAGQLHHNRQLCQLLQYLASLWGKIRTGSHMTSRLKNMFPCTNQSKNLLVSLFFLSWSLRLQLTPFYAGDIIPAL